MRRLTAALALSLLVLLPTLVVAGPAAADAEAALARTPGVPRIAVFDTGIDATHSEFDAGQIIAWRDFTSAQSPTPVDTHGHGTATASLVAGNNRDRCGSGIGNDKKSFAPGAELVIGRVAIGSSIVGNVEAAIQWAVSMDVDVISMSFGSSIPFGQASRAIAEATQAGVLVVVSAGNGANNMGLVPIPAELGVYGNSIPALVVGGGGRSGGTLLSTTGDLDPEVTSWSDSVCVAKTGGGYTKMGGTSFSCPLLAGMAATAMTLARDAGQPHGAAHIEKLMLYSSTNSEFSPYQREGLGWLLDREFPTVTAHAVAGTLPDYAAQGPHAELDLIYHEQVAQGIRRFFV